MHECASRLRASVPWVRQRAPRLIRRLASSTRLDHVPGRHRQRDTRHRSPKPRDFRQLSPRQRSAPKPRCLPSSLRLQLAPLHLAAMQLLLLFPLHHRSLSSMSRALARRSLLQLLLRQHPSMRWHHPRSLLPQTDPPRRLPMADTQCTAVPAAMLGHFLTVQLQLCGPSSEALAAAPQPRCSSIQRHHPARLLLCRHPRHLRSRGRKLRPLQRRPRSSQQHASSPWLRPSQPALQQQSYRRPSRLRGRSRPRQLRPSQLEPLSSPRARHLHRNLCQQLSLQRCRPLPSCGLCGPQQVETTRWLCSGAIMAVAELFRRHPTKSHRLPRRLRQPV